MAPNVVCHSDLMKFREYYTVWDAHIIMFNSVSKMIIRCSAQPTASGFQMSSALGCIKSTWVQEKLPSFTTLSTPPSPSLGHPNYNTGTFNNDFWMIRLQWASKLHPGNLAQLDTLTDSLVLASTSGADLVGVGFGTLTSGGVTQNVMQEVVFDYTFNSVCISQPYLSSDITSAMMCAG